MPSQQKIPLQLQKQRQTRHNKLMAMINSYQLTKQEKSKLQKIKSHTMMEINLRFLRSEINRNFKFPKVSKSAILNSQDEDLQYLKDTQDDKLLREELEEQVNEKGKIRKRPAQSFIYDLKTQNYKRDNEYKQIHVGQINSFNSMIIPLEQSRRVHSLGNQKSHQKLKDDYIIRRHNPLKNSNQRFSKSPPFANQKVKSTKSLLAIKPISQTRKSSKQQLFQKSIQKSPSSSGHKSKILSVQSQRLKLPEINVSSSNQNLKSNKKLAPIQQKLKTQKIYEQEDIQLAIGKKLATQSAQSTKKIRGVQKYLRQLQIQKQNQRGRYMKKQPNLQKNNKNGLGIFKTAKNSLKKQIDKDLY